MNDTAAIALGTTCLLCAVLYVVAEWRRWLTIRWLSKLAASAAFVFLALASGAAGSDYGRLILLALILSLLGDLLLLSLRSSFLLGGIAAFFLAHVAFAVAFSLQPQGSGWVAATLTFLTLAGLGFLRWLWKYLDSFYRIAVPVYLAAIIVMMSFAVGASFASASALLAIAATTFAASDISVARDRFVGRNISNKAWGIPLYYAAQILLAMSVLSHGK